ncbi:putative 16S rRNA-processing protein RimM [Phaeobacter piscinae]|uniref:Ribosome maturation factor RimM n=1 Tax=Phaeobacter piscinae TaxID=1580596 RepID=A0AAN1LBU4_9RHOB|nr:ribosome maturation factor RimM [Phaeobacter piscinae]ATG44910.1 putative 16S rRNA-processing protein RimM [Phaeobacter piscinae]AUR37224.1 putative 16S rRNA-processing protein RimM [Phaeobacter piscinae]
MTEQICVGAISGSYGVRGEVRLKSFCAMPEDIEDYSPLSTEDGSQTYTITLVRAIKNGFTARIGGIESKEQADALKGVRLFAPRERLPNLPDDEYYHTDLMGLEVYDTGGTLLGSIKSVQNHGASDLLEIAIPAESKTVLLPFTLAAVPTVDLASGRIIADPPDGVF